MIPKSGYRFAEKRSCSNVKLEQDDASAKNHPALVLFAIRRRIVAVLSRYYNARSFRLEFGAVMAITLLLVMALHASEAAVWAAVYVTVGALPEFRLAMLYSLEAMTTYGHAEISLEPRWRMMGAVEALDGLMLFGLTTAFLLWILQGATQLAENVQIDGQTPPIKKRQVKIFPSD
jgi:hypothetical protein